YGRKPADPSLLCGRCKNSLRSTGPRTVTGLARSSQNARKSGRYAKAPVVPRAERKAFHDWVAEWDDHFQPEGPGETDAVERGAYASWELKGCAEVKAAATAKRVRHAGKRYDRQRADHADALGVRLYSVPDDLLSPPKGAPSDYRMADPRPLYREVISAAQGADWLLARWRELRGLLEIEPRWGDLDRLRAAVLLGKRPADALLDPALVRLFLACYPGTEERSWGAED